MPLSQTELQEIKARVEKERDIALNSPDPWDRAVFEASDLPRLIEAYGEATEMIRRLNEYITIDENGTALFMTSVTTSPESKRPKSIEDAKREERQAIIEMLEGMKASILRTHCEGKPVHELCKDCRFDDVGNFALSNAIQAIKQRDL